MHCVRCSANLARCSYRYRAAPVQCSSGYNKAICLLPPRMRCTLPAALFRLSCTRAMLPQIRRSPSMHRWPCTAFDSGEQKRRSLSESFPTRFLSMEGKSQVERLCNTCRSDICRPIFWDICRPVFRTLAAPFFRTSAARTSAAPNFFLHNFT